MTLPPEVCSLIVEHVERRADLCTLCLVSKWFRTAAERVLYRSLDVDMRKPSNTILLCGLLAEQPRLSRLVTVLAIHVGEERQVDYESSPRLEQRPFSPPPSHYWTVVSRALRNTTGLRSLRVYLNSGVPMNYAWILNDCSFQLHTLHYDLAWDRHLVSFLSTQHELTNLHISDFDDDIPENLTLTTHSLRQAHTLPHLTVLDCTFTEAAGVLVPGRPVTHVKTCLSSTNDETRRVELALLLSDLRLSTRPICSLTVADESYTSSFSLELLSSIIKAFGPTPHLRYLGPLALPVDGGERLMFYGDLARLPELRSVELDVSEWEPPPVSFPAQRGLARELRLFVPSVVTVVFVRDLEPTVLRAMNGLWHLRDDVNVDMAWRTV